MEYKIGERKYYVPGVGMVSPKETQNGMVECGTLTYLDEDVDLCDIVLEMMDSAIESSINDYVPECGPAEFIEVTEKKVSIDYFNSCDIHPEYVIENGERRYTGNFWDENARKMLTLDEFMAEMSGQPADVRFDMEHSVLTYTGTPGGVYSETYGWQPDEDEWDTEVLPEEFWEEINLSPDELMKNITATGNYFEHRDYQPET